MLSSDAELTRAAQAGDAGSLGMLLERYQASLYAVALRMLGHGPQAQDAVQDTFLVALSTIERLREPDAVGGWLHGILRNVCLTQLKEGRRQVLFDKLPRPVEAGLSEPSGDEAIDRMALREWVWTALSELPEALRVTAMLRYFGSYASYEEIAAILGVPVGTVRSRLNRVKTKLADALLKTAGLEHDEARKLAEFQARYFEAAFEEHNRGEGYETWASTLSEDSLWILSDGTVRQGHVPVVRWLQQLRKDVLDVGVKLHLTNVLGSRDVTILEGYYENPPEDPFHCPPATSMVYFYRDGRVHLTHQYFAPRPLAEKEGGESVRMPYRI